ALAGLWRRAATRCRQAVVRRIIRLVARPAGGGILWRFSDSAGWRPAAKRRGRARRPLLFGDHDLIGDRALTVEVIDDADFRPDFDGGPAGRRRADTKERALRRLKGRVGTGIGLGDKAPAGPIDLGNHTLLLRRRHRRVGGDSKAHHEGGCPKHLTHPKPPYSIRLVFV